MTTSQTGAEDALPVDAAVLVEIGVLGREEGLLQTLRHVCDAYRDAAGLAEGRNQLAVGGIDAQRNLQATSLQRSRPRAGAGQISQ